MTTEVIVYSNPAEKMMWDFLMSGNAFPFIVFFVIYFLTLVVCFRFAENYNRKKCYKYFTKYSGSFLQKIAVHPVTIFIVSALPAYLFVSFVL